MTTIQIRKKPITVEAVQWTGDNEDELITFTDDQFRALDTGHPNLDNLAHTECDVLDPEASAAVYDYLHVTWVGVKTDQFVIRGVKGEFYPIDPEVLAETYDRVEATR